MFAIEIIIALLIGIIIGFWVYALIGYKLVQWVNSWDQGIDGFELDNAQGRYREEAVNCFACSETSCGKHPDNNGPWYDGCDCSDCQDEETCGYLKPCTGFEANNAVR